MLNTSTMQSTASPEAVKLVAGYLESLKVEYTREPADDGRIFFRLPVCPIKGRACGDRTYIIVFQDGGISAACHAEKCADKGWDAFQVAWGTTFDTWLKSNGKAKPKKSDPAAEIVIDAQANDTLFHDADGVAYAATIRRGHPEIVTVRSKTYTSILRLRYTEKHKQIAKREWIKVATDQIEAIATEHGEEHQVCVRVGYHGGKCYIDIGDRERHIIEVDASGWRILEDGPVYFRRPKSLRALPIPEQGGTLDLLRRLVNIAVEDFPLYVAGLVMVYHATGPYPLISFIGGPGHGKSSTVRDTRLFVDPSDVTGGAEPDNAEDLLIGACKRRLVTFDNLDHITQKLSDNLCRLATGMSHSRRTKYSDDDETTFAAKNPVLVTSVKDVLAAADLLDRSIRFVLPTLAKKDPEGIHDAEVAAAAPKVLGLVLNGVSSAIRNLPQTLIEDPPRMVDFALWGTAAEEGLGLPPGSVMAAYRQNIAAVNQLTLESDLAQSIIALAASGFRGLTKDLAAKVNWGASAKDCRELIGQLRQLTSVLERVGVIVEPDHLSAGRKHIWIYRKSSAA